MTTFENVFFFFFFAEVIIGSDRLRCENLTKPSVNTALNLQTLVAFQ